MKKETGIILFVIGLIVGFLGGMITTTAMRPAADAVKTVRQGTPTPLPAPGAGDYGAEQFDTNKANKYASDKARLMDEIKQLKFTADQDPENLNVLISLGNNYFDIGDYYAAIEYYEKALLVNPALPGVLTDLGIMYRRIKNYDKAIENFDRALSFDATFENAYLNKGIVYKHDLNDKQKAIESFNKFLNIAGPDHPMRMPVKEEIKMIQGELDNPSAAGAKDASEESHEGHDH